MEGITDSKDTSFRVCFGVFFCVDFTLLDGVLCAHFATELMLDCKGLKV